MFVETSALVAILLQEPEKDFFLQRIATAVVRKTSVVNAFEAALAVGRVIKDYRRASELVTRFLREAGIEMIPLDRDSYEIAVDAFARFGRGTTHPARLNFGDCLSYAAARRTGLPVLFKGSDFERTDIAKA
ncbi:type II toxin-antitoxin system VapC family toxin [Aquibium microcysteis]|uniref:type II toxin-antitoxin system VapC family toxin n=1 Tax=Aquibium microcysteis TaxID=675281 RepID=UPI00165D192D|nr:type II toxin-antitoxin system VapC family toxin [Aquibium microcysteis]